jgi:pimeloyl-ACP methyl ester carboxylesterase
MKIVTIHANGTSAKLMHPIELATNHISLPGHDNTPLKGDYSLPNITDFVVSELGEEEVILIGNSVGGMIAHQIADKVNVSAIVSIGIPPLNYDVFEGAMLANEYVAIANTEDITEDQMMLMSKGMSSSPESVEEIFEAVKSCNPKVRSGLMPSIVNGDLRDDYKILSEINIPILFIKCSNDLIVNNEKFENLPFGEVVEISGGHLVATDNIDELNGAIKAFLLKHNLI